jgi:hypothetical protein
MTTIYNGDIAFLLLMPSCAYIGDYAFLCVNWSKWLLLVFAIIIACKFCIVA